MDDATLIACVLSQRAINALARCGIKTVDQINSSYPHELLRVHGFGMISLRAVENAFFLVKDSIPSMECLLTREERPA